MKKKKIIAFIGWKNSGKTYIAEYMKEKYGFHIRNFSDPLKQIISDIFRIDKEILEGKNEKTRILKESVNHYWSELLKMEVTPRTMMTGLGMHSRNWCPDIWVALMKDYIDNCKYEKIVIPDLRLSNEYEMLKNEKKYTLTLVWILRDRKPWWIEGIKAAEGNRKAIDYMKKNNIHITEYEWLKFIENCDYIYENNSEGINEKYIEEIIKIMENKK